MEAPLIREIEWSDDITQLLARPAASICLPFWEAEVRAGISQLWECRHGADVLHVVTRLDSNPCEWVWCYACGRGIRHFADYFFSVAKAKGWPVRMHTRSPGIVRIAARYGLRVSEFILTR